MKHLDEIKGLITEGLEATEQESHEYCAQLDRIWENYEKAGLPVNEILDQAVQRTRQIATTFGQKATSHFLTGYLQGIADTFSRLYENETKI